MKEIVREKPNQKQKTEEAAMTIWRFALRALEVFGSVLLTLLIVLVIAGCVVAAALAIYISNNVDTSVDDISIVSYDAKRTTKIMYADADGELTEDESQRLSSSANAEWVPYSEMPDDLINAFVAIEDKRFWDHKGVDWITTIKATAKYFLPLGGNPGGSTITQQLVKNVTGDDDYTIQRKVQEIFRALNLEKSKDKTEILEAYLNIIYLSQDSYGVQAAARTYFNKDVKDLTLLECVAIAGITQYPTKWDPIQHPENNILRRNDILYAMYYEQGSITKAQYEECYNAELKIDLGKESDEEPDEQIATTTSWYTDAVIEDAIEIFMAKYGVTKKIATQMVFSGGYTIVSAQDPEIQKILEEDYADISLTSILPSTGVVYPESSFIVIDPYTGNILGLVGGRGEKTGMRVLNRATQTKRSPGSSMKPLSAYSLALETGLITYGSVLDDTPYNFGTVVTRTNGTHACTMPNGWPQNSNRAYAGRMPVDQALYLSKNTIAVKLVAQLGVNRVFEHLTEKLHFTTLVATGGHSDKQLSSLALGGMTYGVTLRELTTAYSIFPTGGVYTASRTIVKILDSSGEVIVDNEPKREIVLKEGVAQSMVRLMRNVIEVNGATAYKATGNIRKLVQVAGKTGTTDDNNDKWFIGYSPYYLAGIWVGYDEPANLFSTSLQTSMWDHVMCEIHEAKGYTKANLGDKIKTFDNDLLIEATYCRDSGKLLTDCCENDLRIVYDKSSNTRSLTGYFTKDTLPTEPCDVHVWVDWCTEGKGVACQKCIDAKTTIKVGMLNVERKFPVSVYVTDAQYTWREVPEGVPIYASQKSYFYKNILPTGYYAGISDISSKSFTHNRICPVHYSSTSK